MVFMDKNSMQPLFLRKQCENKKEEKMNNRLCVNNTQEPYISEIIEHLNSCKDSGEALDYLFNGVEKGDFTQQNGILFINGECRIQNIFKSKGTQYNENVKLLNKLGLSIIPKHLETVVKDSDMFIISKMNGTKSGDITPYLTSKQKVSKEDKLAAFKDLQKLTKAGYTDDSILKSSEMWFVTPDDNKIVIPVFGALRPVRPGENKQILERYYQIIFGE